MSASANERSPQRVRFFDWLIKEINSESYEGLRWLDENHTTFRIPWKHNSRKSLVANDYKIFQAWALVSGKYVAALPDPAKWKTNFRCALKSTRRFELVSESKDPDPHHVYRIRPLTMIAANPPANTAPSDHRSDHEDDQLHISPYSEGLPTLCQPTHQIQQEIDVAFETLSLGNPVPVLNGNASENFYQCSRSDAVQWPVHHMLPEKRPSPNLGEVQQVAWVLHPLGGSDNPTGSTAYEPDHSYIIPQADQNSCLLLGNGGPNRPVVDNYSMWPAQTTPDVNSHSAAIHLLQQTQQDSTGTNIFNLGEIHYSNSLIENVFMNEEAQGYHVEMNNPTKNGFCLPVNEPAVLEQGMFMSPTVPSPADQSLLIAPCQYNTGRSLNMDVSIYYRGKLLDERHVEANICKFAYDNHGGSSLDSKDAQIVKFPNPETLPDRNQVKHTLTLLQSANLLLHQKNEKIYATRLGRCKVFMAFSKQLENIDQDPQSRLLPRNEETEIFNYGKFFKELKDFYENQRGSSPDYTIYLCFGQCFSCAKPKELKLILVKLVPTFCKTWHEHVQKEGASSLSENMSLQISNSLHDMIEEFISSCNMQM